VYITTCATNVGIYLTNHFSNSLTLSLSLTHFQSLCYDYKQSEDTDISFIRPPPLHNRGRNHCKSNFFCD